MVYNSTGNINTTCIVHYIKKNTPVTIIGQYLSYHIVISLFCRVPIEQAVLQLITTGVNVPIILAGTVIEDAGEWFKNSGDWFGDRAGEYSRSLGNTAENIGNILAQGGQDILSSLADDFKDLGKDLESTAKKIEKALEDPLGGFLGLGNGFSNLDTLIGNALSDVENALSNVLGSLENFGNDVKDFFTGNINRIRKITFFSYMLLMTKPYLI